MPTWGEVLKDLVDRAQKHPGRQVPVDDVRREALAALSKVTKRPVVLYASRWVQGDAKPEASVNIDDVHGLMETLHGLSGPSLDLIIHSSGGSPTAAEAIIKYIRTKFDDVRVIVPLAAMSAGTIMACGANRIVMGKHSYLGPIDPQMVLQTPMGVQLVPAYAIREQFAMAQKETANPQAFGAWIPMLQQYGPGLLVQCNHAINLSETLVTEWLQKWMLAGNPNAADLSKKAAAALNDHGQHMTHGRFLNREVVRSLGLVIDDLEHDQAFQDAVLTVFHAFSHTFAMAGHVQKIIENNLGKSYLRQTVAVASLPLPGGMPRNPQVPPPPPAPPSGAPPTTARLRAIRKTFGALKGAWQGWKGA